MQQILDPSGQAARLDFNQEESGNRGIVGVLAIPSAGSGTISCHHVPNTRYEVWAARGHGCGFHAVLRDGPLGVPSSSCSARNPICGPGTYERCHLAETR